MTSIAKGINEICAKGVKEINNRRRSLQESISKYNHNTIPLIVDGEVVGYVNKLDFEEHGMEV